MSSFDRYPHPDIFRFLALEGPADISANQAIFPADRGSLVFRFYNNDIIRVTYRRCPEEPNYSTAQLNLAAPGGTLQHTAGKGTDSLVLGSVRVELTREPAALRIRVNGDEFLASTAGRLAGTCGPKTIFCFARTAEMPFHGMGEKTGPYNKSGRRVKFYNADVMADFPHSHHTDSYDPSYVSIPVLFARGNGGWFGLYYDNPAMVFFDLGHARADEFHVGSEQGQGDVYVLTGPTLADVVRRFAALTGRAELPPLWALGYQQCRWGYKSEHDVRRILDQAEQHDVPIAGLWLDIDHMDGYRVFSWNHDRFPDPKRLAGEVRQRGARLVTIVDPGVKREETCALYQEGRQRDLFCKTPDGIEFIGLVWPGITVFPDFSLPECRAWWAEKIANHLALGIDGIWIDMNDPSTHTDPEDLWFAHGTVPHVHYHSQYANLMAQAVFEGFARHAQPQRPFTLTRSAFTGIQRWAAVWTGDNHSSWEHLRMSIPMSLNLSLSGVALNGPDVPGFAGEPTDELARRWFQAGFLFPFLRNHACAGTRDKEPWSYTPATLTAIRAAIHARIKLLPLLYDLFWLHSTMGEPVMRPLNYEFPDPAYDSVDDQYLVGSTVMVAPIVFPGHRERRLHLPPGWWYDFANCQWREGQKERVNTWYEDSALPIYFRDGAILPVLPGVRFGNRINQTDVEFHVFSRERGGTYVHVEDDGETRGYREGRTNRWEIQVWRQGGDLSISAECTHHGYDSGLQRLVFVVQGPPPARLRVNGKTLPLRLEPVAWPVGGYSGCRVELKV